MSLTNLETEVEYSGAIPARCVRHKRLQQEAARVLLQFVLTIKRVFEYKALSLLTLTTTGEKESKR